MDNIPESLPVPGYEGSYEATENGEIFSVARTILSPFRGKIINRRISSKVRKSLLDRHGYEIISLCINGRKKRFRLNRLVCAAFHGPPMPGMDAAHNDGKKRNNKACNLRWATRLENAYDKIIHGTQTRGENVFGAKLTSEQVLEIISLSTSGVSRLQISLDYGVSCSSIRKIILGHSWSHVTGIERKG